MNALTISSSGCSYNNYVGSTHVFRHHNQCHSLFFFSLKDQATAMVAFKLLSMYYFTWNWLKIIYNIFEDRSKKINEVAS